MIESRSSSRNKNKINTKTSPRKVVKANNKLKSKVIKKNLRTNNHNKSKSTSLKPHPSTSNMVNEAIMSLNNRRHGSSLHAIKKYVNTNYQLDPIKTAPLIRRYLKKAVFDGTLVQTKGQGSNGSFKLPPGNKNDLKKKII